MYIHISNILITIIALIASVDVRANVGVEVLLSSAPAADTAQIVQQWERTYDRQSRLLTERHRMGRTGDWMTLTENVYDAVGRLRAESFGTAITREYAYDVRSRITKITSGYYRQTLGYTPGGNVAAMSWWAFGPYETERKYVYTYDALSRLTSARYSDGDGIAGLFDTEYAYDLNGNITRLWRNGVYDRTPRGIQYGPIDDLTLEYDGNRLVRVADACAGPFYQGAYHFADGADEAVEYTYDAAGNTVSDLNRGITAMVYDDNSRPRRVGFADGSQTLYLYDASGLKRRTVHRVASLPVTQPGAEDASAPTEFVESVTDYCGGIVYEDSVLTRINLAGGYLRIADNSGNKLAKPEYHFYHRDHLGNNRMDLDGTTGGVHQITHYYPYGMPMDCGYIPAYQRWLFGDKEFDRTSGLDLYDFEARAYDPALGRFRQPDPLAEKYRPLSPYLYCAANPMIMVDPTGEVIDVVWDILNVVYDGTAAIYYHATGNHDAAKERWVDVGYDFVAAITPGLPAGLSKAAKIYNRGRKASNVTNAARSTKNTVHGNSKKSEKAQHVYEIFNTETGEVVKTGISGGKTKAGKSVRATRQVNAWNKKEGKGKYDSRIVVEIPAGPGARETALKLEKENANKHKKTLDPNKHKRPKPK